MRRVCVFLMISGLLSALPMLALALPDGLFARFDTTMGTFTCRLNYPDTPRTVANFVNLVEGERVWGIDRDTGQVVSDAFYQGVTFHRVITNFVIQAGLPNAPSYVETGYRFADEFTTPVSRTVVRSCLAMANAGPDTNSSQFFIPVSRLAHLDDTHTVFGWVAEGMDVVDAISLVATDTNNVPLTPVTIQDVTILRNGADAQNWDPSAVTPPLPEPTVIPTSIANDSGILEVNWGWQGGLRTLSFLASDLDASSSVLWLDATWMDGNSLEGLPDSFPVAFFWTIRHDAD